MPDKSILYDKPLIQMRAAPHTDFPAFIKPCYSSEFWSYIENNKIDKIVAMRVYPNQDCIAFKLRFSNDVNYTSRLLKRPELRILQRLWEHQQPGFNFAIKYYLIHSPDASRQYIDRRHQDSAEVFKWYAETTMGAHVRH